MCVYVHVYTHRSLRCTETKVNIYAFEKLYGEPRTPSLHIRAVIDDQLHPAFFPSKAQTHIWMSVHWSSCTTLIEEQTEQRPIRSLSVTWQENSTSGGGMSISVKHFMQMKLVFASVANHANRHQCAMATALSFLQEADAYEVCLNRIIL